MAIALAARPMVSPELIRQFREDFEVVRSGRTAAGLYLQYEDEHTNSARGMKRTLATAVQVGTALYRMHSTESYLDEYRTWQDLCRALHIARNNSYRLMSYAKGAEGTAPIADKMTAGRAALLDKATQDEKAGTIKEAAEGDADAAFERLRAKLQKSAEVEPVEEIEEFEVPMQVCPFHESIGKKLKPIQTAFDEVGLGAQAASLIRGLIALAERAKPVSEVA